MKKLCYSSFLFIIAAIMSCKPNMRSESTLFWVNSSKIDCVGVGPMQCLQIKRTENGAWENFYDRIEGIDFEPGFIYQIELKIDELNENPLPADKSNLKYTLVKTISKEVDKRYLLNDIWVVTSIGDLIIDKTTPQIPQVEISLKSMQIIGKDGCNNFRGSIEVLDASVIKFGPIMNTKKLCSEMKIPNAFNTAMSEVRSYSRKGLNLTLFNKDGVAIIQCLKVD